MIDDPVLDDSTKGIFTSPLNGFGYEERREFMLGKVVRDSFEDKKVEFCSPGEP